MKIKNIYIGSWFPKIKLHLDEFKQFLNDATIHQELDTKKAKELFRKLRPQNVHTDISAKGLTELIAENQKGFTYSYYEDGLLLLKGKVKDFRTSRGKIVDFYQSTLTPCLAYIFSRGAKGLEIIRLPKLPKRIIAVTENANKRSINTFFNKEKEAVDESYNFGSFEVYFAENIILINAKSRLSAKQIDNIVQEIVFLTEINRHLYWLLQTHRFIWEEAKKILDVSYVQTKQLPRYIEKLTIDYKNVTNINSRIDQMQVVLASRKESLKNISDKKWHDYFENKFQKTKMETNYIKKTFIMTSGFLKNNITYLSSLYQEISEEAIRRLQFLFLINVVSSFLVLGTIFGANILWYEQGELVGQGKIDSFNFAVLISFGFLTLLLSSIIYYFWNNIFKNLTRQFKK